MHCFSPPVGNRALQINPIADSPVVDSFVVVGNLAEDSFAAAGNSVVEDKQVVAGNPVVEEDNFVVDSPAAGGNLVAADTLAVVADNHPVVVAHLADCPVVGQHYYWRL